jgi:hypothetical protein
LAFVNAKHLASAGCFHRLRVYCVLGDDERVLYVG